MDLLRLTLAILAALLALVFVGIWFAKGRQHSKKGRGATLFYAGLLFASAGALYLGSQKVQRTATKNEISPPLTAKSETKEIVPTTSSATGEIELDPAEPKSQEDLQTARLKSGNLSTSGDVAAITPIKRKPIPAHTSNLPKSSKPKTTNASVEDVIESSILGAFDIIEVFFETYGYPVSVSRSSTSGKLANGSIVFRSGSAELSQQSIRYLRTLATQLDMTYQDGQLEIRAQSNEQVDSPVHRFLLTQSRAEAVRDVLVAEGFPASRLVPIGSETEGETRVKFVHRPN